MTDLRTIQDQYASMTDAQLLNLLREERAFLTTDAWGLLKKELQARQLNWSDDEALLDPHTFNPPIIISKEDWSLIEEAKANEHTDDVILVQMMERGKSEEEAKRIIDTIPAYVEQRCKKYDAIMLIGSLLFVGGLAVTFLPISPASHLILYILAYCSMLFGGARFLHAWFYKRRYRHSSFPTTTHTP